MPRKTLVFAVLGCVVVVFGSSGIDLNNLLNYANQPVPDYIIRDNQPPNNPITDAGATLGRVLFYDVKLSLDESISCANCHQQNHGFSDLATASEGFEGGATARHSMRLINGRFAQEIRFFWDERAATLEDQTTQPIQDHIEMGFSGENGQPGFDELIERLNTTDYYPALFAHAFGDEEITENRIQRALSQFVRSIQSFDSRYDEGRALVANDLTPFPNFSMQENMGKQLFLNAPPMGAGCQGCHRAPEFDIDPVSLNNGIIGVIGDPDAQDLTNTRAPSLRDLVNPSGEINGGFMHTGEITSLVDAVEHYNAIAINPNLDPRLAGPNGQGQNLNLAPGQINAIAAFLATLTGTNVYIDERWSNPFTPEGELEWVALGIDHLAAQAENPTLHPNPAHSFCKIDLRKPSSSTLEVLIYTSAGKLTRNLLFEAGMQHIEIPTASLPNGLYLLELRSGTSQLCRPLRLLVRH